MKRLILTMTALMMAVYAVSAVAIVPQPQSVIEHGRAFVVRPSTVVACEAEELAPLVGYVCEYLDLYGAVKCTPRSNYIALALDKSLAEEEYSLAVSSDAVIIAAGGYGGAFNGVQTLLQLLPSKVYTKQMRLPAVVRGCDVKDKPKYAYRGFMLDVARTFMTKENVLRYIDYISYHKINKLHWHLTDNQGWRIEIKSHPDLAKVAGFRGGDSPLRAALGKWEEKYGGYYTQEDIREVVEYAAVRNVEIIPEIDLPGHSEALLRIYPEMLCNFANKDLAVNGNYDARNAICATKEGNYKILEEILAEICTLFPSHHLHIGGDEVRLTQWLQCPDCSAWLKRHGYTDGYKLEDMFINRIQAILAKYGKSPSVWNEAAFGGGLSKEALVYGWKSADVCKQVMQKGYRTIFMPQEFFYLDMRQSRHEEGRLNRRGAFDLRKTYSFDFAEQGFTVENTNLVEGFEAPFWSEIFLHNGGDKSIDYIEYMTFPRLCAVAEQGWGKNGGGEWEEFHHRLYTRHYDRMCDMGLNFRITPPEVKYEEGMLSVEKIDNSTIYYRDDSNGKVCKYKSAISTSKPAKYLFWAEYRGAKSPEVAHASRYETLKPKVKLTSSMPENPDYPFSNVGLYDVNKMRTSRTCRKGDWILFEFEEPVECREIEFWAGAYGVYARMIPKGHLELSEDGVNFERVAELDNSCVRVINPRPIKAARIVADATYIGGYEIRFSSPIIYPKW
ncbi:MAG: family 20 glycosylhydrolase [Alistipes sp.]|nr:family 20 glycosylhydrolase [Alistipes sp.]